MDFAAAARDLLSIRPYHRALGKLENADVTWSRHSYGPHARQYGLLALRPEAPGAPLAVYFHGGGWQFGSPELLRAFGAYFYRRGFHVWMPSHRRLPRFRGCDIRDDAVAAMRYCFGDSRPLPHSPAPRQVLLAGVSSGGQLAALMALRQNAWHDGEAVAAGLAACGSPLSLEAMGPSPTRYRFAGRREGTHWCDLDPLHHLTTAPDFPAVVLHGQRDGLVPVGCSEAFVAQGRALGWTGLEYLPLPGGDHLSAARWVFLPRPHPDEPLH